MVEREASRHCCIMPEWEDADAEPIGEERLAEVRAETSRKAAKAVGSGAAGVTAVSGVKPGDEPEGAGMTARAELGYRPEDLVSGTGQKVRDLMALLRERGMTVEAEIVDDDEPDAWRGLFSRPDLIMFRYRVAHSSRELFTLAFLLGCCVREADCTIDSEVQLWCARFACGFLMGKDVRSLAEMGASMPPGVPLIRAYSKRYGISGRAQLAYLLHTGRIGRTDYDRLA